MGEDAAAGGPWEGRRCGCQGPPHLQLSGAARKSQFCKTLLGIFSLSSEDFMLNYHLLALCFSLPQRVVAGTGTPVAALALSAGWMQHWTPVTFEVALVTVTEP